MTFLGLVFFFSPFRADTDQYQGSHRLEKTIFHHNLSLTVHFLIISLPNFAFSNFCRKSRNLHFFHQCLMLAKNIQTWLNSEAKLVKFFE